MNIYVVLETFGINPVSRESGCIRSFHTFFHIIYFHLNIDIISTVLFIIDSVCSLTQENVNITFIRGSKNHSAVIAHIWHYIPPIF